MDSQICDGRAHRRNYVDDDIIGTELMDGQNLWLVERFRPKLVLNGETIGDEFSDQGLLRRA